jgi:hypothetical protein
MAIGTYGDSYFCKARVRDSLHWFRMFPPCLSSVSFVDESLSHTYFTSVPAGQHPSSPCINFFSEMAQENESLLQGVIDARFLEMVLWLFSQQIYKRLGDEGFKDACNHAFTVLSTSLMVQDRWGDYVNPYCPDEVPTSLAKLIRSISASGAWSSIECHILEKHAGAMLEVSWPVRKTWSQPMIDFILQTLDSTGASFYM